MDIRGYKPVSEGHIGQIKRAIRKIKKSKRPVICAGGGVTLGDANEELRYFAESCGIPVVNTLMGIGAISADSENYFGMVGSHGHPYAKEIISEADLLIVVGARLGNRSTVDKSAKENIDIIHIDIDTAEIGKNLSADIPVVGDAKSILKDISERIGDMPSREWLKTAKSIKENYEPNKRVTSKVHPCRAIEFISNLVDEDAILTGDVGQNQIWCARNFEIRGNRKFLTSGGLGTMGYSLPASIGAKFGAPDKTVIGVMGDAGIQMLLAELGVIKENNLDIIIIVFNNSRLGMVRELQDNIYGAGHQSGVTFEHSPDFVKIAEGFGIKSARVENNSEFEDVFEKAFSSKEAFLMECIVESDFSTI